MNIVSIVGTQWGDEGKGKIVDWLSSKADVVVRFQGGHNAGHTLVIDGKVYKLSLLPSGIVRSGKISIIGNGVVICPESLLAEIDRVSAEGVEISEKNLIIAENATLILPVHKSADAKGETSRGVNKIGTTGRGIGPAYEDKVARRAIRVCDLENVESLKSKVEAIVAHHRTNNFDEVYDLLLKVRTRILPMVAPAWKVLHELNNSGKRILFEGAQGIMLDVDHGTYPFVTSSNTVAGSAFIGSGLGARPMKTLGICKAYTTRVGSGPFPTEQENEVGETLGRRGHEFGTVTGRKRRCGWLDAIQLKQSIMVGGINSLVLTKLDVLDDFEKIKICVGYEIDGKAYDYLPAAQEKQAAVKAKYIEVDGWKGETTVNVRELNKLPKAALAYIKKIEELVGVPIDAISTSPERDDTIEVVAPYGA